MIQRTDTEQNTGSVFEFKQLNNFFNNQPLEAVQTPNSEDKTYHKLIDALSGDQSLPAPPIIAKEMTKFVENPRAALKNLSRLSSRIEQLIHKKTTIDEEIEDGGGASNNYEPEVAGSSSSSDGDADDDIYRSLESIEMQNVGG